MISAVDDQDPSSARIAIVTGAARGLGASIASRLARNGVAVALLDLSSAESTAQAIRESGGVAVAVQADITDAAQVEEAVAAVTAEIGAPTILVNNAGVTRDNLIFKMTEDDWDTVMLVHLRGTFLMSRAVQRHQVKAGWGRIINISSLAAQGNRGQANYSAAKAGLIGFTRTLALELGKFGVTVNAIAPGFIATDMTAATAERLGLTVDDYYSQLAADIPAGRVGQPEDIANAVDFFAGEASGFVSGQTLFVAGGPV